MANPVLVQSKLFESSGTSVSALPVAFTSNNTAGNGLVAFTSLNKFATPTVDHSVVSDTQANSWVKRTSIVMDFSGNIIELWTCQSCAAGANTVTAQIQNSSNASVSTPWSTIHVFEVSGGDLTDFLDAFAGFTGGTSEGVGNTTALSAALTTLTNSVLIILFTQYYNGGHSQTINAPLSLVQQDTDQEAFSASGNEASAGAHTYTATLAAADTFNGIVISIKPPTGGGGSIVEEIIGYTNTKQIQPDRMVTVYA